MLRADVELAWKTQAGHRHHVEGLGNEDAVFVTEEHPLFDAVLMVADGMGGHPRPQEASAAAVHAARQILFNPARSERAESAADLLAAAVHAGHRAVRSLRNGGTPPARPPGTTLSVAAVADGVLHVAHVGDGSVLLMREGQVSSLAGGEHRRAGNRPAQYLGQEDALEPEQRQVKVAEGDRLLLCTDGLTRYFNEAGAEALERILGRRGVEIQVVASQLTAHSRPDEYDDDTTVALAEVTALRPEARRAPPPEPKTGGAAMKERVPARELSTRAGGRNGAAPLTVAAALFAGGMLVAGGFLAGRLTAPVPGQPSGPQVADPRPGATAEELKGLPPGNLILVDAAGSRVFALATRSGRPVSGPIDLDAHRLGATGRLQPAGRFHLDPQKGVLSDREGHVFPVEMDYSRGAIRILRGGTIVVKTQPKGARVIIDGRDLGPAPQRLALAAGRHHVRVEGASWVSTQEVEVLPGKTLILTLEPQ